MISQDVQTPQRIESFYDSHLNRQSVRVYRGKELITELPELKLNLGCGNKQYEGYVNVDKVALPGVQFVHDLEKTPLPFDTNSVSEIRCEHILEHIVNYMPLLEEMHRISKPNAKIHVLAPYYKYEAAFRDPTHVRFFTEHSFDYFHEGVKFSHYSPARFEVDNVEKRIRFISDVKDKRKSIMKMIPNFVRPALDMFLWNVYSELKFEMRVIK